MLQNKVIRRFRKRRLKFTEKVIDNFAVGGGRIVYMF